MTPFDVKKVLPSPSICRSKHPRRRSRLVLSSSSIFNRPSDIKDQMHLFSFLSFLFLIPSKREISFKYLSKHTSSRHLQTSLYFLKCLQISHVFGVKRDALGPVLSGTRSCSCLDLSSFSRSTASPSQTDDQGSLSQDANEIK